MRSVAIILTLAFLANAVPLARAEVPNDCAAKGILCTTVTTSGVSGAPPAAVKTYYVYTAAALCAPTDNQCRAAPPAARIGLVWEETNGLPGLQRSTTLLPAGNVAPDTVIVF